MQVVYCVLNQMVSVSYTHLDVYKRQAQVNKVLLEIGAANVPQILIHNQIDRVGLLPEITRDEYGRINTIHVSAKTGEGMDLLRLAMAEHYQFLQRKNTEESAYV